MLKEGKGLVAVDAGGTGGKANVTVVTDADYRSLFLPCDALDESEGPAQMAGPALVVGKLPSRATGR